MQRLLACWWLMVCSSALGQLPSFKSFNPPQFATNSFIVSLKDPLVVTNITVVSNLVSQTIITTNLFTTNLYVTNIFNDITFNGRVTFNTNVTFVTNVFGTIVPYLGPFFVQTNGIIQSHYRLTNLPTGTNDIFVAPVGYVSFVSGNYGTTNQSGTTVNPAILISGTYYKFFTASTLATNNTASVSSSVPPLNAGETFSLVTSSAGLRGALRITSVPTNYSVGRALITNVDTSVRILHTGTAGKTTYGVAGGIGLSGNNGAIQVFVGNFSGSSVKYKIWYVEDGGSPSDDNLQAWITVANLATGSAPLIPALLEGETIQIQSDLDTATQFAWINYGETL